MGKKGKKAKKKAQASTNIATTVCNDEECVDTTPTPKHGWVYEMYQATATSVRTTKSKSIGAGSKSERSIVRLARAYRKLRLWEKLDNLVSTTLEELPQDDAFDDVINYKLLVGWHKEATDILSRESLCDRVEFETIGGDLDTCITGDDPAYRNINILHSAVLQGDVRLLEEVVARGAAIDYPVGTKTKGATFREGTEEAPRGATALVLGCMVLSMHGSMPSNVSKIMRRSDPRLAQALDGTLECVVQLVKLGANCHVMLNLDDDNDSGERGSERRSERKMMKSLGLHNKTAYELAALSKKEELIRTMKEFRSISEQITIVHCRCGSRLPWKDCHGNEAYGTSYCHQDHEKDTVCWKLSQFVDCACKNNKKYKKYFNCCWPDLTWYQNDSDGNLFSLNRMVAHDPITKFALEGISKLRDQAEERGGDWKKERVFPGTNRENCLKMFRSLPPEMFYATIRSADPGGISDIYNWDFDVYTGTMERIGNYFHWNDLHWALAKTELLVRVKEWNAALSNYCDDHHLMGKERADVIRIHTASPFARCANPSCTEVEVKVKQFRKCSRCSAVAYCSTNCQKEQWPTHRARCHKAP